MDQDGLFLVLSMCSVCRTAKGSWKKCMSKRHNPKLATISQENLTFAHRQCVKPDQTMTIYKLRNRETNEELLEFSEDIVFQTPCPLCTSIKGCIKAGHHLQDWQPAFSDPTPGAPSPNGDAAGGGGEDEEVSLGTAKGSGSAKLSNSGGGTTSGSLAVGGKSKRSDKVAAGGAKSGVGSGVVGGKAGGGKASSAGASGSTGAGDIPHHSSGTPKLPHKRKSPGQAGSPPAKASKVVTPKSSSSSSSQKTTKGVQKETNPKRSSKDRKSTPSEIGSNGHRGPNLPKLEPDEVYSASDGKERPLKRRNKHGTSTTGVGAAGGVVGLNSHGTATMSKSEGKSISAGSGDASNKKAKISAATGSGAITASVVSNEERKEAGVVGESLTQQQQQQIGPQSQRLQQQQQQQNNKQHGQGEGQGDYRAQEEQPQQVQKTPKLRKSIAERLEDAKAEESKLLIEFEATHKKCEKEEEAKRSEMVEFQRAGEAAIREMRKKKEEALRWIAARRQKIATERQSLVKLRMKELEAEEERARRDALEKEEKLEAEKKALTDAWSKQDSARVERSESWDDEWSSSSIFDFPKVPSSDVKGSSANQEDVAEGAVLMTPAKGNVQSASNSCTVAGARDDEGITSARRARSRQNGDEVDTSDGCDSGHSAPAGSKPETRMSGSQTTAGATTGGGVAQSARSANISGVDAHPPSNKASLEPEAKAMDSHGEGRESWSVGPARLTNTVPTPATSTVITNSGGTSGDKAVTGSLVRSAPAGNHAGASTEGLAVAKDRAFEKKASKIDPVKDKVGSDSKDMAVRASKSVVPMVGRPGVAAR